MILEENAKQLKTEYDGLKGATPHQDDPGATANPTVTDEDNAAQGGGQDKAGSGAA